MMMRADRLYEERLGGGIERRQWPFIPDSNKWLGKHRPSLRLKKNTGLILYRL